VDEIERDRRVLRKFPLHILLLVKAAKKALEEGRGRIKDGMLFVDGPPPTEISQKKRVPAGDDQSASDGDEKYLGRVPLVVENQTAYAP
jgi:hypothetical protein